MHDEQITLHGGTGGIRDSGLLSSALLRPQHLAHYGDDASVFDAAAAYSFGIVRNHPFVDGNKRTGFLAAYVFLFLNGWHLEAREEEAVYAVMGLASGDSDEASFSSWLKMNSVHRS